jgi:hypothetical protein
MKLSSLERKFSVTSFPGMSVFRLTVIKTRVLAEWAAKFLLSLPDRRKALSFIRKMRGAKGQHAALVVGNGPSVAKLNWEKIAELKKSGLELFVVNYFLLSDTYEICRPDYLVLSDPKTTPNYPDPRNSELWSKIRSDQELKLVVPISWYKSIRLDEAVANRALFFDDGGLEGWTRNISPTKARGYIALTAYKALAISVYFGYKRTYVIGIDNSMFRNIAVSEQNELIEKPNHFFSQGGIVRNVSNQYPNGIADYFNDMALCFFSLRHCFRNKGIVNLDMESLVDCFEKKTQIEID